MGLNTFFAVVSICKQHIIYPSTITLTGKFGYYPHFIKEVTKPKGEQII